MQTLSSESCATATAAVAAGQATSTSRANTAAIALPGRQQVRTAALRDAVTAGTKSLTVHVGVQQHMVAAQDHQQWGQGSYLGGARALTWGEAGLQVLWDQRSSSQRSWRSTTLGH